MTTKPPYMVEGLNAPIYDTRCKLRGYNRRVTVLSACTDRDAAKLLKRLLPALSGAEHMALALRHAEASSLQEASWSNLADQAAQESFGRPFRFGDYRVSGIARDEFSPVMKDKLRFAAHAMANHKSAARAHWVASTRKRCPF